MTSSAQTPEPTDEQRAVAMAAVWPDANPLMWKFATDDDKATRDRVARALAAAVTAEREKYLRVADALDAPRERSQDSLYLEGIDLGMGRAADRIREVSR